MGYLLLFALGALSLAAGAAVAGRWASRLPAAEQAVAAGVVAAAVVLLPLQLLGYLNALYPWSAALLQAALAGGLLAWAGVPNLREALRRGLQAARTALASPAAVAFTAVSLLLLAYLAAYVVLVPSWGWDALTYHDSIIGYAFQNHGLSWVTTSDWMSPMVNGYPRNLELFGLWLGLFTPRDLLIDGGQLYLVALAVVALAGLCRRMGAGPALAWCAGLCFLWLPAAFLNAPSNYNDVGVGALFVCAVSLATVAEASALPFAACALGLLAGSKITAPLLVVMAGLPFTVTFVRTVWRQGRARALRRAAALLALVVALGGGSYLRNAVHTGNPLWPVAIPFLHLPSPRQPPIDRPPFGGKNDLTAMWRSWTESTPIWLVDTRSGGFGQGFLFVLLPLGLLGLCWHSLRSLRTRAPWLLWPAALFVASGWFNPYRWWARFTFGFAAAAILGTAALLALLPRRWLREGAALALGAAMVVFAWPARAGFFGPRLPASAWWDQLALAWQRTPEERATPVFDHWNPPRLADRDRLVQPGEAALYDDSVSFIYLLWRPDWKNRVLYLPLTGAPDAWLARVNEEGVRWAQVRRRSLAERVLAAHGWRFAWPCPIDACAVWVREGPLPVAAGAP